MKNTDNEEYEEYIGLNDTFTRQERELAGARLEGKDEGKIEGRNEEKLSTARNMLKENATIPFIERVTGLTKTQILNLKKEV